MKRDIKFHLVALLCVCMLQPQFPAAAGPVKTQQVSRQEQKRQSNNASNPALSGRIGAATSGTPSHSGQEQDARPDTSGRQSGSESQSARNKYAEARLVTLTVTYAENDSADPRKGKIEFLLYPDDELKGVRRNFNTLITQGAYDSLLFHRVIENFMIQTGDPRSRDAQPGEPLGSSNVQAPGIAPMPFVAGQLYKTTPRFHKYGAVAVARVGDLHNPQRDGSTSQFYIVTDHTSYSPEQLQNMAAKRRQNYAGVLRMLNVTADSAISVFNRYYPRQTVPEVVLETYSKTGGAPYLDEDYTVIGEVVRGMEVVEAIQRLPKDKSDRPLGYARIVSAAISDGSAEAAAMDAGLPQPGNGTDEIKPIPK